ncbi:CreA family protein [Geminicoccus flavidas]|uniref:CreA family protein n=1 Tax=Geminicoccus flavidas TaxID=2506407 RepID=UPI00135A38AF|nr:CreA family protein [Geminicoccus flavidas]
MRPFLPLLIALPLMATPALAQEEVGEFSNDWTGNGIVVQAFPDPGVQGVTCHVASFSRSLIDRMTKGNWFEDPSNSSIACRQTGPIVIGDIETDEEGEDIFSERRSLIFKSVAVRRIWDQKNQTMVYVVYSRQVTDASAKLAISTVPLFGQDVRREQ